jgi:Fe-S cluster biogenesis protein NfuA
MSDAPTRRRIRAQASASDPQVMGFVLDAPLQAGRAARFDGPGDPTDAAPLARALFDCAGVIRVEVSETTIWVRKDPGADWAALKPAIAAAIRQVLDETITPLGRDDPQSDTVAEADTRDAPLLRAVRDLLERQVNPSVAAHGGHIAAERVEGGTVYLRMSGGCQGCAASAATLRQGVERMLRAALPQIDEIVDVTDHEAGSTPFYAREGGPTPMLNRPVPPGVIGWDDGQLMVDPDYLAPRLGLSTQALRDGLRSGDVVGATEAGAGADAGKTRVVLRSATRAWAAEVLPDGSAREIPPPRETDAAADREQALADRVRTHLAGLPPEDCPITYGALARALGLWAPGSVRKVTRALEMTMREDAAANRPFIAARAVSRGREGLPGQGFFELARALSRGPQDGESDHDFHAQHLEKLNEATLRNATGSAGRLRA